MAKRSLARWSGARLLTAALVLLVLGTGPFLTIEFLSIIGIGDPDPNPVLLGPLAFVSFVVAITMAVIGLVRLVSDRMRSRGAA